MWRPGYQQSLHYRKVLRHWTTWKTIGPRWFLYNVHTWTGNRLLSSTQPPPKNYFCTAAILTLTQSRRIPFEGRAPTDSAIRAPGTITCHSSRHEQFPRGSFLPLFKPFCQLKRHKRLRALPSSLYKSSAEEDSRHSDILKPRFTGVIYSRQSFKKKKNERFSATIHHGMNFSRTEMTVQIQKQFGIVQKNIQSDVTFKQVVKSRCQRLGVTVWESRAWNVFLYTLSVLAGA